MSHAILAFESGPLIVGPATTELDPAQLQVLAGSLSAHVRARDTGNTVELGRSASMFDPQLEALTGGNFVPMFMLLIQEKRRARPRQPGTPITWDYAGSVTAVDKAAPGIIQDHLNTTHALGTVVNYGERTEQGRALFRRDLLSIADGRALCAITFLNPQAIVHQSAGMENWVPRLGLPSTRALGRFVTAAMWPYRRITG